MANAGRWAESELQQLIQAREEESLQLEFKGADSLQNSDRAKNEISKDVSSFANSIGGDIIYGIAALRQKPPRAAALSPVDPASISQEWLEQVINSRIQPRIPGIIIIPVRLDNSAPGMVAYVVSIPQGTTAYQASDKRYYRRYNFQAVPMEDYEVRQAMSRTSHPSYRLWLKPTLQGSTTGNQVFFNFTLLNTSELVGHDVSVFLYLPVDPFGQPRSEWDVVLMDGVPYMRIIGVGGVKLPQGSPLSRPVPGPVFPCELSGEYALYARASDAHGLALSEQFKIHIPSCRLALVESYPTGRNQADVQL